jgi:hypothetical protein
MASEAPTAGGRTVAGKLHLSFDIDFLGYNNSHSNRAGLDSVRPDSNNNCIRNQPLGNNPAPAVGADCAADSVRLGGYTDSNLDLGDSLQSIPIFSLKRIFLLDANNIFGNDSCSG